MVQVYTGVSTRSPCKMANSTQNKKQNASNVTMKCLSDEDQAEFDKLKAMYDKKNLNECFALMHLSHQKDLKSVRDDLDSVKVKVTDLEAYTQHVDQQLKEINEVALVNLRDSLTEEEIARVTLEQWGRKWNIVIRGVEGDLSERPRVTESKVRKFFVEQLKLDEKVVNGMYFQAVHRLPGGDEHKRRIILRFLSLLDRDDVMEAARRLPKGSGFGVSPDLNPEASKLRGKLLSDLRAMEPDDRKKHRLIYLKEFPFVAMKKLGE